MKPISKDKNVLRKITNLLDEMDEQREYSPKGSRTQRGDPFIPVILNGQKEYFVAQEYLPPEEDEERESYNILNSRE